MTQCLQWRRERSHPEIFATPSDVAAPALSERSPLESGELWRSYELVDDLVEESTQIS